MRPSPLELHMQRFIAEKFGLEIARAVFPDVDIYAIYYQRPRYPDHCRAPYQPRQSTPNR